MIKPECKTRHLIDEHFVAQYLVSFITHKDVQHVQTFRSQSLALLTSSRRASTEMLLTLIHLTVLS